LNNLGIRVIRFENSGVWENLEGVLEKIRSNFHQQLPLTSPKTGGESWKRPYPSPLLKQERECCHTSNERAMKKQ